MEINKRWNDYKVCLCGQFGVGKTTIFQKVAENFGSSLESVSKGDFAYVIDDPDLGQKKIGLYDTANLELYDSSMSNYYRGAQCIILVYDISSEDSFKYICKEYIKNIQHKHTAHLVVLRNKIDLEKTLEVEITKKKEIDEFSNSDLGKPLGKALKRTINGEEKFQIFNVSGKENVGVEDFFRVELIAILKYTAPTKLWGDIFQKACDVEKEKKFNFCW